MAYNRKSQVDNSSSSGSADFSPSFSDDLKCTNGSHNADSGSCSRGKRNGYEAFYAKMLLEAILFVMLLYSSACIMAGYSITENLWSLFLSPLSEQMHPTQEPAGEDDSRVLLKASVCKGRASAYMDDEDKANDDDDDEYTFNLCFGRMRCDEANDEWMAVPELAETTYAKYRVQYLMSSIANRLREKHGETNDHLAMEEFLQMPLTCERASFHPDEIQRFREMQQQYMQRKQMMEEQGENSGGGGEEGHEQPSNYNNEDQQFYGSRHSGKNQRSFNDYELADQSDKK